MSRVAISMELTTRMFSVWTSLTISAIFSAEVAVSVASLRTSSATTAKPRPASPARAASMVAFRARRLVCWAILVMTSTMVPICWVRSLSAFTPPAAPSTMLKTPFILSMASRADFPPVCAV